MTAKNSPVWGALVLGMVLLSGCKSPPPDYRNNVTLPVYAKGDASSGEQIYRDACAQCHTLNPGHNNKGPQLMNVYGAPAAALSDYQYSEALKNTHWVWDAKSLDHYLADATKALPDTKMLADPMPDATERADVIAYLSTLRQEKPATPNP
ncbi:c-type cytochrome [Psychrobacter aestuarii]|uniref:C-type cytochrome n=1 Tax=Psychrobacter aestuarii TaxID=556327 RepID=A0ABP3FB71_9GAMM|nr:c-type cytochrome [Psychrobacter aestuarii]